MTWIMVNVPIMVVFVALWVGIPTWLVLKHPDRKPTLSAAPAVRNLVRQPGLSRAGARREDARREDVGYRRVA